MAGAGNASLEVLWNLIVSPVEVNAMEMVFLAEFEVVVNHDLRIPFGSIFWSSCSHSSGVESGLRRWSRSIPASKSWSMYFASCEIKVGVVMIIHFISSCF